MRSQPAIQIVSLLLTGALAGCASTMPPPSELVDARRAYASAAAGPAHDLVPADLLSAQQALARAEQAFANAPDSPRTRDLAYVAERRAEIAAERGVAAADSRDKASAEQALAQLQAARQADTEVKLTETRAALATAGNALAVKDRELTSEQRARQRAEREARAAMASLEKVAAVKEEARGLVITLSGSVLFATNQDTLLPIAEERLAEVAKALADNPNRSIVIEGHTDSTGSVSANDDLSRRRAESVGAYLIAHGVQADRIRAVGMGSRRPIADNATVEGRANNRRVEIIVQPETAAKP